MADTARDLLTQATLNEPETVSALRSLYDDPEAEQAAIDVLAQLSPDDPYRLIPVLYFASGIVAPSEPFVPWLDNADSTVRYVAASACAERGEEAGIRMLVDLLADQHLNLSTHSPAPIWVGATLTLARLTGQMLGPPVDADDSTRIRACERWRERMETHVFEWSGDRREWD